MYYPRKCLNLTIPLIHQLDHRGHLTWRLSQFFPWISPLFHQFPNKSSKSNQSPNWMGKKGWLSLSAFYNHTSLSPLYFARIDKNSVPMNQGKSIFFEYQHLFAAYPYIPFVFFFFHENYPLNDLDIYWQHYRVVCANAGISLAALTSRVTPEPMKYLHLHTCCQ